MNKKKEEHLERIKEAVYHSPHFDENEKSLILEKIEEWRHEDEAMRFIPSKLVALSEKITPILEEMGLL